MVVLELPIVVLQFWDNDLFQFIKKLFVFHSLWKEEAVLKIEGVEVGFLRFEHGFPTLKESGFIDVVISPYPQ